MDVSLEHQRPRANTMFCTLNSKDSLRVRLLDYQNGFILLSFYCQYYFNIF